MANQYCTAIKITENDVSEVKLKIASASKHNKTKYFVTQRNEKYTPIRQIVFQDVPRAIKDNLLLCETVQKSGKLHTVALRNKPKDFPYLATVFLPCVIVKFGAGMLVPFFVNIAKKNTSHTCDSTKEETEYPENVLKITAKFTGGFLTQKTKSGIRRPRILKWFGLI